MLKKPVLVLILFLCFTLLACNQNKDGDEKLTSSGNNTSSTQSQSTDYKVDYSVWITYWDVEDIEDEIGDVIDKIDNICYFAAYFDKDKRPFIPKQTLESLERVRAINSSPDHNSYLTFVNDLVLEDDTSSLKDVELLYALFQDDKMIDDHIQDILDMTINGGFKGIEIDYEGIRNDMELWELFTGFVNRLYQLAKEKDILVRVVLEPSAPLDKVDFPNGPEYVIMCYNLHGHGSGPGPKANKGFIEDLIRKSQTLSGKVGFALATGGFDFQSKGGVKALTEREAVELLSIHKKEPIREKESQALFFEYMDHDGEMHQVWYADSETLSYWISIIGDAGVYDISLWRLGGNLTLKDLLVIN